MPFAIVQWLLLESLQVLLKESRHAPLPFPLPLIHLSRGEELISSTDLIKEWKCNLKRKSGTEDLFWYAKIWGFACWLFRSHVWMRRVLWGVIATWSKFCQMCTVHLPGWRTDKADGEYDGLSVAKGIKVIVPRMSRPSVPNRNRSPYFLQSTIQKSKWKK